MILFKKFKAQLLIISLFFFLLCSSKYIDFPQLKEDPMLNNLKDNNLNTLYSLEPSDCFIYINSDHDLINYSFSGSGTEYDPYRIENLLISTVKDYGIYIENITKYIIIQNCYIYAHYRAIEIYNTTSNTITITNNTCSSDNYFGIFASKSSHIKILRNTFYNCYYAIEINESPYAVVENNTFLDNICCIRVEYRSPYSYILNNNITNNYEAIYLFNSGGYFLIKDNLILNNSFGIILSNSPGPYYPEFCLIINNLIKSTQGYGILIESNNNLIYHNSFIYNNLDGSSQAKDDGLGNVWYNKSLREGNYWSDWLGFGSYQIKGSGKSYDLYPLEKPFNITNTQIPKFFIGRVILRLSLGLGYPAVVILSFLIVEKSKKKIRAN